MGDAKKRWEELGKAEKLLEQDVALVPLYQRGDAYVQNQMQKASFTITLAQSIASSGRT